MGSMSPIHWLVVLAVAVLLFGGSRLSSVGKGLGEGIKNFKKGLSDSNDDQASADAKELEEKSAKRPTPPDT